MENVQSKNPEESECPFHPKFHSHNGQGFNVSSPYQLRNGAQEGCEVCSVLFALVTQLPIGQLEEIEPHYPENLRGLAFRRNELYYLRPSLVLHVWKAQTMYMLYTLKNSPLSDRLIPAVPVCPDISHGTGDSKSLSWAQKRLRLCDTSHPVCREARLKPGKMPTRLIDMSAADGKVKLCNSSDLSTQSASYICLSYCWGTEQPLKLLKDVITGFYSEIPWNDLPVTFQDVIAVARKLGISYLWVDSLCIIQDDVEDFRHEASEMASVYGQAWLVITASKSKSLRDGLFSKPSPPICSVPFGSSATEEAGNALFARKVPVHLPSRLSHQNKEGPSFPTLERAWIFQERMLATRVLHFGPDELAWECLQETVCECAPDQEREPVETMDYKSRVGNYYFPYDLSWRPKLYHNIGYWQEVDEKDLCRFWFSLVEKYSQLKLTYPEDCLLAFSGIATEFSKAARSRYVAGLWEKTLIQDLCWETPKDDDESSVTPTSHQPRTKGQLYSEFRSDMPSWSWASVSHRVEFHTSVDQLHSFCPDFEINCCADFNPTGKLEGASITVLSHVFTTTAWIHYNEKTQQKKRPRFHALGDLEHNAKFDGGLGQDIQRMIEDNATFTCLILGLYQKFETGEKRDVYIALVLVDADEGSQEAERPRFRRVGLATFTNKLHDWEGYDSFRPSEDKRGESDHVWRRGRRIKSEDIWSTGFMGVEIRSVTII